MKILIAIADIGLARTYEQALCTARNHELTVCRSKVETLQHFHPHTHEAAIIHGDFPDGKGVELVAALRHRTSENFPIIGLSASTAERLRGQWIQAGATAVIGPELDLLDILKTLGVTFGQSLNRR